MVPGLLRAERRQRPGQRPDQGGARRGRVGDHRSEGVDVAGPPGRLVLRRVPDRAGVDPAQGPLLPAGAHGPARRRGPAHHPAHPDLGVQRGLLRRRPHRSRAWSSGGRRRMAGGARHLGLRAGRRPPRPQLSFRRELDHLVEVARANGRSADPVIRQRLARSFAELEILRLNTLRSLSGYDGPVAPPEASIIKLYWASWHRQLGRAGHGRPRGAAGRWPSGPLRARRVPADVPVQPVRDDLRRLQRDPEEHHRRAGPRPAARAQGRTR